MSRIGRAVELVGEKNTWSISNLLKGVIGILPFYLELIMRISAEVEY